MFWNKRKKEIKPVGVQIKIEINAVTLSGLAGTSKHPSIERMSSAWLKENCTRLIVGIAAINSSIGTILYVSGSDGCVYKNMEFEIKLPFSIGKNKTDVIQIMPTENLIFIVFEGAAIMAFPSSYIFNLLSGESIVEYNDLVKNTFGEASDVNIKVTSENGEYNLPISSKVSKQWFKYENTAVKVLATLILSNEDFPLALNIRTE